MKRFLNILIGSICFAVFSFGQSPVKMNVIQDICWTPDGTAIFFSAMRINRDYSDFKPEKWNIFKYERSSKRVSLVVRSAFTVSVASNGKKIAYGKFDDGNQDIYSSDTDGENEKRLTDHVASDSAPTWSPDGKHIAFNSKRSGTTEIFAMNSDGTEIRQLTKSGEYKSYNPSWSPDGNHIAYYLEKGDRKDQIHVMNSDGTNDTAVTNDEFNNIFPGWINKDLLIYGRGIPDGKTYAYTVSIDGKLSDRVPEVESFYTRYSPDGVVIAYVNKQLGGITIVDKQGTSTASVSLTDADFSK